MTKTVDTEWPLWEVFVQERSGAAHQHVGSVHAVDAENALQNARDTYCRREDRTSIWVVPAKAITASKPGDAEAFFDPADDKPYRHPQFYATPKGFKEK